MNYVSTRLRQSLFVDAIVSIHYFEYTAEFGYLGERHDFWELIFCDKGTLDITAGDNRLVLGRGQAYLHPPGQYHNVRANGKKSANSIIFSFESSTEELYSISDKVLFTDDYVAAALFSILREAKLSFSNRLGLVYDEKLIRKDGDLYFGSEQIIQNYTELLLIHFIRQIKVPMSVPKLPSVGKRDRLLERVLEYMDKNIGNRVTFADITEEFSVSPTTMKKLFVNAYNHGTMEHLTRMRIERSKELLRDGQLSCTDIAIACGFCSVHHYSSTFKKYEQMSPTEYAKSVKAMLE